MKFVLLVEGATERALDEPLRKWFGGKVSHRVGIQIFPFEGATDLVKGVQDRAKSFLASPRQDVIAVISLLDLYNVPLPIPSSRTTAVERVKWAKQYMEKSVGLSKFRQFFAVHEVEAWLLCQPDIFPEAIRDALMRETRLPEAINMNEPPSALLNRLYHDGNKNKKAHGYKKVVNGTKLFARLDPEVAYLKCPNLKAMLDEMLRLAQEVGL